MTSGLEAALFAILLGGLALLSSVVGMLWRRDRARAEETGFLADELERQGLLLQSLTSDVPPSPAEHARPSVRPTPPARQRTDLPSAKGPVLIAVPDLVPESPETIEVPPELSRRFGAIWDLADSGAPTEAIARATGHPIGQVELMLALRRPAKRE